MKLLNKGKLNLYYLGDGPGDKNFPEKELLKDATLSKGEEGEIILSFEMDYPAFPIRGIIYFNLDTFSSQYDALTLYYLQTLMLSDREFMIVANYVWTEPFDLENFEIVTRFGGQVPSGLDYKVCPSFS